MWVVVVFDDKDDVDVYGDFESQEDAAEWAADVVFEAPRVDIREVLSAGDAYDSLEHGSESDPGNGDES